MLVQPPWGADIRRAVMIYASGGFASSPPWTSLFTSLCLHFFQICDALGVSVVARKTKPASPAGGLGFDTVMLLSLSGG